MVPIHEQSVRGFRWRSLAAAAVLTLTLGTLAILGTGCHIGPGWRCPESTHTVEHKWALGPRMTGEHRDTLAELLDVAAGERAGVPESARLAARLEVQRAIGGVPTNAATGEVPAKEAIATAQAHRKELLDRTAEFNREVKRQGGTVVAAGPFGEIDVIQPTVITRQVVVSRVLDRVAGLPVGVIVLIPAAAAVGLACFGWYKRWEWLAAIGLSLAFVCGCVGGLLLAWDLVDAMPQWLWIVAGVGVLLGVLAWLVVRVRKRGDALREVVTGVERLKVVGDLSEAKANGTLQAAQSPETQEQVKALLPAAKKAAAVTG